MELIKKAENIRRNIVNIIFNAKASHLGSSLSLVEILTAIYSLVDTKKIKNNKKDRDIIILSKGHGAAALYSTLTEFGILPTEQLETYHKKHSTLQGHVSHHVSGVEHSTGSLGHGLSVALGHAIYRKNNNLKSKVFVVCGDGEIQEGSCWEAIMLASTLKLGNLFVFIDFNKISSITLTENVINTGLLENRFKGFGLETYVVNGHDISEIITIIENHKTSKGSAVLVCNTIKGKGIDFAENEAIWHYKTLDSENFIKAISQIKQ